MSTTSAWPVAAVILDAGSDGGLDGGSEAAGLPPGEGEPDAGSPEQVFASGEAPENLTEDADTLYWVDHNPFAYCSEEVPCELRVRAAPKAGGEPVTLARLTGHSLFLASDGASVYFGGVVGREECNRPDCPPAWKLYRVEKGGGSPVLLASGLGDPDQLTVGAIRVFLAGAPEGQPSDAYGIIGARRLGFAAPKMVAPGEQSRDVLLAGGRLYWSVSDGIRSMPEQGGPPTQLFLQPSMAPSRMVADGRNVYFLAQGSLWAAPLEGGIPRLLVEGSPEAPVSSMDVKEGAVFWTRGGCLGRVEPDGSGASCLSEGEATVESVKVDEAALFAVRGGDVIRLPR